MINTRLVSLLGVVVAALGASAVPSRGVAAESAGPSCEKASDSAAVESALLKAAPGAHRIGKHAIEIKLDNGVKRFTDTGPTKTNDGTHWTYCGYDKVNDLHLIGRNDDQTFTGVVLLQKTGKSFVIGQSILVSPDGTKIFGSEQEDGEYGENWTILGLDGTKVWGGYGGMLKPGDKTGGILAIFEKPSWDADGNLTAKVNCNDDDADHGSVTLKNVNGAWSWAPAVKCPDLTGR